jgi:mono/diheme cytochrome c family protein
MKSFLKLTAFLGMLSIGCFAFVSTPSSRDFEPVAETSNFASAYGQHCATCHGPKGDANTPKGQEVGADDLTTAKVQNMSSAKLTGIIKNGKGDMPGFPRLSTAQINSIIRTVKSF